MTNEPSAKRIPIVSRDRVIDVVRPLLRAAVVTERRFTVEQIADLSGVEIRAIRSYMANDAGEVREPPLSAALSLAVVLGPRAVNAILAIVGYSARPLEDADAINPMLITAEAMTRLAVIASAASDGRIDHLEQPLTTQAADDLILIVTPLSSAGRAA